MFVLHLCCIEMDRVTRTRFFTCALHEITWKFPCFFTFVLHESILSSETGVPLCASGTGQFPCNFTSMLYKRTWKSPCISNLCCIKVHGITIHLYNPVLLNAWKCILISTVVHRDSLAFPSDSTWKFPCFLKSVQYKRTLKFPGILSYQLMI